MVHVGLTLPSFNPDPEVALAIARSADATRIDGVFVYDHLFRLDRDGARRPALECFALLSAVATATQSIAIGTLVARAALRAPSLLARSFATVRDVAGDRVIAAIGAGDAQSRSENESFGYGFGSLDDRLAELAASTQACVGAGLDDHGGAGSLGSPALKSGIRIISPARPTITAMPARYDGSLAMVCDPQPVGRPDHIYVWINHGTSNAERVWLHRTALAYAVTEEQAWTIERRRRQAEEASP